MTNRWQILDCSDRFAIRTTELAPFTDDIEMSGFGVSDIVEYGRHEDGTLYLRHHPVFPALRLRPNDTNASFQTDVPPASLPPILLNGEPIAEVPLSFTLNGTLEILSRVAEGVTLKRVCFPSSLRKASYEMLTLENRSGEEVFLACSGEKVKICEKRGCMGNLVVEARFLFPSREIKVPNGVSVDFALVLTGRRIDLEPEYADPQEECALRLERVHDLQNRVVLHTGNEMLDTAFGFAALRAGESVFATRAGLLHSPGGYAYYAAVWANDQVEYSGTWFPYTGDPILRQTALNAYRLYIPFMSETYEPFPSSIIAEGVDYWDGAGDRGDAAMYLYGASYFALTCGDRDIAKELWAPIKWCATYCEKQKTPEGVIASDADELEHRLPCGKTNLSTSSLTLGGLRLAANLALVLGEDDTARLYTARADALAEAIEKVFAADLHGFDTYRYHDGCEVIRSWICLPLCMGQTRHAHGTVQALLSESMMTPDGLRSIEGEKIVWDRSTIYALRAFAAVGEVESTADILERYTRKRLLGDRVPYPVEAYPENGKRHLSGESSLYLKIYTDGLLGMVPKAFDAFEMTPRLPEGWEKIDLNGICYGGKRLHILVLHDVTRVWGEDGLLYEGKTGEHADVRV